MSAWLAQASAVAAGVAAGAYLHRLVTVLRHAAGFRLLAYAERLEASRRSRADASHVDVADGTARRIPVERDRVA